MYFQCFNWQAVAALATFAAVIVALYPIWRTALRRRAKARSLRFRLSAKLGILRPSLIAVIQGGTASIPSAIFTKDRFRDVVHTVNSMMRESAVLEADEQDQFGLVLINLEAANLTYATPDMDSKTAQDLLKLIDDAMSIMSKHGLLHRDTQTPWGRIRS